MISRRHFFRLGALGSLISGSIINSQANPVGGNSKFPVVVSTWNHGLAANEAAWEILDRGGSAIDAVEAGARVTELDPDVRTVGYGGRPDITGRVTLDASIMDEHGNCGAVACLEYIKNPISVARRIMEKTPHVMLVGEGALEFALDEGFVKENLLTPESEKEWKEWLRKNDQNPISPINVENHDTIGLLALDAKGNLSGACTTSGAAWKMRGRVGDSPIIGAGLFVDNEVGAACATGWGEAVIRIAGSHLVVEFMRQGYDPETACRMAVDRTIKKYKNFREIQVGFLALNKDGQYGSFCIQGGFDYAVRNEDGKQLIPSLSLI